MARFSTENCTAQLGAAARGRRDELGLTQQAVADLAGVHRNYLAGVERGERNLSLRALVSIAAALELDASALLRLAETR